ncbi:MAG: hypothetical protein ACYC27_00125 [Armatimonadota bacterium]
MDSKYDLVDLQRAANILMVQNKLKPSGISGIVFGALALLGGYSLSSLQDQFLALIGLFLIFEGIWVLLWPSANGLLMNSVGIAAVGIYNIVSSFLPGNQSAWPIFGLLQLQWAFSRYKEYKMFKSITALAPSDESFQFMKALVKDIETREVDTSGNMIRFILGSTEYKAILMDRSAVLVSLDGKLVLVWNRLDAQLAPIEETDANGNLKVFGSITNNLTAVMSTENFSRFDAWSSGGSLPSSETIIRQSLKQRTKALAQVVLTLSTGALIVVIFSIISSGIFKHVLTNLIAVSLSILPIFLWSRLLKMQKWAWTTLTVLESILSLAGLAIILIGLIRFANNPHPNFAWDKFSILVFVVSGMFIVPLLLLLTDKPSGWRRTETVQDQRVMEVVG